MEKIKIRTPSDCLRLIMKYGSKRQEHFGVICLDNAKEVLNYKVLFKGGTSSCNVYRNIVAWHIANKKTTSFILFHNHPSGNSEPSADDINTTKTIKKIGDLLGIQLLDHIIVSKYSYFSFLECNDELHCFDEEETSTQKVAACDKE